MRNRLALCGWLLFAGVGAVTASDVKETVRITVTEESLPRALALDDSTLLAGSNVFAGRFIGAPSGPPAGPLPRFRLSFDIQTLDGVKRDAYVLYYVKGEVSGQGYIYVPGEQDSEYRLNASTILRDGVDGTWRHAAPGWAAALNALLPGN